MVMSKEQPANPPGGSSLPADVNLGEDDKTTLSPKEPHERDQGAGVTGGIPSRRVQQGSQDIKRGLKDTSRSDEADETYKKRSRSHRKVRSAQANVHASA